MRLTNTRCQCGDGGRNGGCGEYFNSVSAFDRHRVGNRDVPGHDRWCLSEFGMEAIGMLQVQKGNGRLWYTSARPHPGSAVHQISGSTDEATHG
jgi:hypothetical protein